MNNLLSDLTDITKSYVSDDVSRASIVFDDLLIVGLQ